MESMVSQVLNQLKEAERRLQALNQESQALEAQKQVYLKEIMKGAPRSVEIKKTDQALLEKGFAISSAKEQVGNLRAKLEARLADFRKDLIQEKQREHNSYVEKRTSYLNRIEELEVEKSRYRYLVTGRKDQRLANKQDLLPSEARNQEDFVPIDEIIGRIKLEISRISRMSSQALLEEYLAREKKDKENR